VDDPTPANPLEQAMLEASRGGDPDPLFALLASAELYVPAPGQAPQEGAQELAPGDHVALPVFEHQGERFVPAFTSLEALQVGAPDIERYVRATAADLARMWPGGHHLALNPGAGLSVAIAEDDVRALGGAQRIPAGAELTLGAPAAEPEELWERLRAWAATTPEVRAAHRALVLVHDTDADPQLVVALDLEPDADPGRILNAGAEALGGEAAFTLLDPGGDDPLSGWMLEQGHPLYVRAGG
jgi:hypothetical protein